MKIILTIFSALTLALSNVGSKVPKAENKNKILSLTTILDESILETETFKPGTKGYSESIFTVEEKEVKGHGMVFEIDTNFKVIKDLISTYSRNAGLLNGKTYYELIGDNLFIDPREFLGFNFEAKLTDGKETTAYFNEATEGKLILESKSKVTIAPLESVKTYTVNFVPKIDRLLFGDKRKVQILGEYIDFGKSAKDKYSLFDLFKWDGITKTEEETIQTAYTQMVAEIQRVIKEDNRISSKTLTIIYANQNSETQSLLKGYNVKMINKVEGNGKFSFPLFYLLLPLILFFVLPFSYFTIRKVFKI